MIAYFQELWTRLMLFLGIQKPLSKAGMLNEDDIFNAKKQKNEKELNRILDKINKKGMPSLNKKEREFLEKNSG